MDNGQLLVSGEMLFQGADPFVSSCGARLNSDGSRDALFPLYPPWGCGKVIRRWNDRFYVDTYGLPRRLLPDGLLDPTFQHLNDNAPLFSSFQGGDYPGLKDFVMDSTNSSYAVRNALMNVAPKVSKGIWELVFFTRRPAMNPWHLAQALLANSPLEAQVLLWLDTLDVNPFYKELVLNGQNGGMSMHTLYRTDMEHFYSRKADLLTHALGRVLHGEEPGAAAALLAALDSLPTVSGAQRKLALQLALGDLQNARSLVDAMRMADSENGYWKVQDMLVRVKEESKACSELTAADRSLLEAIAADWKDPGQADAQAWLTFIGVEFEEDVEFPSEGGAKQRRNDAGTMANGAVMTPLRAYPNPTAGPLYLVYTVPEGVEQAELRVMDTMGRLAYSQRVAPQNGIAEMQPQQVTSGMHVAMLLWDGIRVGTAKVSLIR